MLIEKKYRHSRRVRESIAPHAKKKIVIPAQAGIYCHAVSDFHLSPCRGAMDTRRRGYDVCVFDAVNSHRPWRGVASEASRGVAIS